MESCSLPDHQLNQRSNTQEYHPQGYEEVQSLEEARRVISALRARQRAQAHQMLAWRRTLKLQVWCTKFTYDIKRIRKKNTDI